MTDLTNNSLKKLSSYTQDDVNKMTEDEFMEYFNLSTMLENKYMYYGKKEGPEEFADELMVFGTNAARLGKLPDGNWVIQQAGGLMPQFKLKPVMLNAEDFRTKMKELGVSDSLMDEYFNYKPDYSDF